MKRWIWSLCLALCLCLGLLPVTVAASGVTYLDEDGTVQTCTSAELVTETLMSWGQNDSAAHWYVAEGNVTIGQRVTVTGEVHLILADGCKLTASQGIQVAEGNSLTIYAQSTGAEMGVLEATGSMNDASIGGSGEKGGTITINGGKVTATGGENGACIGGGSGGAGGASPSSAAP